MQALFRNHNILWFRKKQEFPFNLYCSYVNLGIFRINHRISFHKVLNNNTKKGDVDFMCPSIDVENQIRRIVQMINQGKTGIPKMENLSADDLVAASCPKTSQKLPNRGGEYGSSKNKEKYQIMRPILEATSYMLSQHNELKEKNNLSKSARKLARATKYETLDGISLSDAYKIRAMIIKYVRNKSNNDGDSDK